MEKLEIIVNGEKVNGNYVLIIEDKMNIKQFKKVDNIHFLSNYLGFDENLRLGIRDDIKNILKSNKNICNCENCKILIEKFNESLEENKKQEELFNKLKNISKVLQDVISGDITQETENEILSNTLCNSCNKNKDCKIEIKNECKDIKEKHQKYLEKFKEFKENNILQNL